MAGEVSPFQILKSAMVAAAPSQLFPPRTKEKAKPRAFSLPPVPSRGPVKAPTVPAAAVAAPTPPVPTPGVGGGWSSRVN